MASIPSTCCKARTLDEQRALFEKRLAPMFDKPLVRWLLKQPASLYGLGIPPAQYKALAGGLAGGIGAVLSERLERLACDFDIADNYFAWQAFGRRYAPGPKRRCRPISQRENFDAVRSARRPRPLCPALVHRHLARFAAGELRPLRPARRAGLDERRRAHRAVDRDHPHRAAGRAGDLPHRRRRALLPGRVPDEVLAAGVTRRARAASLAARDRSSIYGAFHLYTLKAA